jgi:hypothetical protein
MRQKIAEEAARELRRTQQQGMGRPIIGTEFGGRRFVAVGGTMHWGKWKTFFDFLSDYIKQVLGGEWDNTEIAKPLSQRHPVMQWYDAVCHYQQRTLREPGKVHTAPMTGATAAYFGLAYSLYLLAHNVALQHKLISRLKNRDQFQGAYYETLVAAWFVLAGFELTLEDESDSTDSHCEFTARSKTSGKSYSVEAKSRGPNKDHLDVGAQLGNALRKTAAHQRIVMIDVNVPDDPPRTAEAWLNEVMQRLKRLEPTLTVNGQPAPPAFVVVTNHPYRHDLDGYDTRITVLVGGFKIPDYGLDIAFTSLIDAFKTKQKHIDIFRLGKTIAEYRIPATFDGEVPEFAFGEAERKWKIGGRYDLSEMEPGAAGVLTTATVSPTEKLVYLAFQLDGGRNVIATAPMTDAELSAYTSHPDTFFGVPRPVGGKLNTPLELFEWLHENYRNTPREKLLEFLKDAPDLSHLSTLPDDELRLVCCERWVFGTMKTTGP